MKQRLNCILLIDDNDADNNYHKNIIEEMDIAYSVQIAENGLEAIKLLSNKNVVQPDLIFLDVNMPKMNGWEFLEAYKKMNYNSQIMIVILTNSQNPANKKNTNP